MSGDTYPMPADGWVCFHCGVRFTTPGAAALHFGAAPDRTPGCLLQRVPPGDDGLGLLMALRKAEAARDAALAWSDADAPLPEDAAIRAAAPFASRVRADHDRYMEAMRLVGAKRSKGALVDLVNWLLARIEGKV